LKISMSQITMMRHSLEEDLPAIAAAGFKGVEISLEKARQFLITHEVAQLREMLASLDLCATGAIGLAASGPALLLSHGTWEKDYFATLLQQFELCKALKIDHIGIGADHIKWVSEENWTRNAEKNLRKAARMAADFDMRIGLEFLSLAAPVGPFILDCLAKTRALVETVGDEHLGINVDFFHHYRSGGTDNELSALPGEIIVGVHVTDVAEGASWTLGDGDRLLPGQGVLPLTAWRDALLRTGFDGYFVLELLNESLWQMPPERVAHLGMAAMTQFRS